MTTEHLESIAARLDEADGLLLGLDFDGTLAPIDDDPDAPTLSPDCRRALQPFLTSPNAVVAVISGRALSDLRGRVDVEGIVYAGNHGLELTLGADDEVHPGATRQEAAVRRTVERLRHILADVPGCEVEDKRLTATVHVRQTPSDRVDEVRAAVEEVVEDADASLRVSEGKQVFEIRPDVDWDKGAAIERIAESRPDGWQTVYVGDDETDEDAFQTLRPDGVGVLVGTRKETAALHRLPDQGSVAPFLEWLAETVLGRPDVDS